MVNIKSIKDLRRLSLKSRSHLAMVIESNPELRGDLRGFLDNIADSLPYKYSFDNILVAYIKLSKRYNLLKPIDKFIEEYSESIWFSTNN